MTVSPHSSSSEPSTTSGPTTTSGIPTPLLPPLIWTPPAISAPNPASRPSSAAPSTGRPAAPVMTRSVIFGAGRSMSGPSSTAMCGAVTGPTPPSAMDAAGVLAAAVKVISLFRGNATGGAPTDSAGTVATPAESAARQPSFAPFDGASGCPVRRGWRGCAARGSRCARHRRPAGRPHPHLDRGVHGDPGRHKSRGAFPKAARAPCGPGEFPNAGELRRAIATQRAGARTVCSHRAARTRRPQGRTGIRSGAGGTRTHDQGIMSPLL